GRRSSRSEAAMPQAFTVSVVVFSWWSGLDHVTEEETVKAFSDSDQAEAYCQRCYGRRQGGSTQYYERGGGAVDRVVTLADQAEALDPQRIGKLWVVRVVTPRGDPEYDLTDPDDSIPSDDPFGIAGVFASPEEANAFRADLERQAAESGIVTPLLGLG